MSKFVMGVLACLIAGSTFAADTESYQPFTSSSEPLPTATPSTKSVKVMPHTSGPALTPKEFKSSVNSAFQQNQEQLNQEIKQNLTKNLPVAAPGASGGGAPGGASQQNSSSTFPPQGQAQDPGVHSTSPVQGTMAPPPQTPGAYQPASPLPQPQAAPTQSQQYTGFGSGNNGAKAAPKGNNQKSGSGWNIQY